MQTATKTAEDLGIALELEPQPAHLPAVAEPVQQQRATPDRLLELAITSGAGPEQLKMVMDFKERWDANERVLRLDRAREAMYDALADFALEPLEILKKQHVSYQPKNGGRVEYDHANLNDVVDEVRPKLAKHGISLSWIEDIDVAAGMVFCTCVLRHRLGHEIQGKPMPGPLDTSGNKNDIQSMASTVQYLRRYTTLGAAGAATKEVTDNDGRSGKNSRAPTSSNSNDAPDEMEVVRQNGEAASMEGVAQLTAWWKTLGPKERSAMNRYFGAMTKAARKADEDKGGAHG